MAGYQQVPHDFFEGPAARLGGNGTLLYLALRRHANKNGMCYPSVTKLQEETGLGRNTVLRGLIELEKVGAIVANRHHGSRNMYTVKECGNWCQNGTSPKMEPVPKWDYHQSQNGTRTGAKLEPEEEPVKKNQLTRTILLRDFDVFWAAYPSKKDKQKALQEWQKLKPSEELVVTIMAGLSRAKESREFREGYIVYGCRWLKNRRWEDQPSAEPARVEKSPPDRSVGAVQADAMEQRAREVIEGHKAAEQKAAPMPAQLRKMFGGRREEGG